MDKTPCNSQDGDEVRKGPWTVEEDLILINHIANHGEGLWNSLAKAAGLKRTGKSCRLRWLNYLRPDVKRGNITTEEQLLIMELHSQWGNKWSKIATHLPGRTDNEIKNFWRTRIQKHINKQAETFPGRSSEACEQATSSQMSAAAASYAIGAIEDYSAPSYPENVDPGEAFPMAPLPVEFNETYWSMEDYYLWLLNGD